MRLRRLAAAMGSPVGAAVLAASLAVALRLPFLHALPYPDEGGLLVVAQKWHGHGPFLYGSLFVDRPPLLLLFFRLAAGLGGIVPLRLLGLGLVAGAVMCAGRAGLLLGGHRGAGTAAAACAALLSDPLLGTREVDAETVGVPLVLTAAVCALEGLGRRDGPGRIVLLVAAGAAGSAALLVKQNLADGLVFVVLLVGASWITAGPGQRRTPVALGWVMCGAAIPIAAAVAWSTTATGVHDLWFSLYGFRIAGSASLFNSTSPSQVARLHELGRAAVLSGLVLLVVTALAALFRRGRADAVTTALIGMLAAEVVGVAGGGYYWTHYLIGLVPATCLLVARASGVASHARVIAGIVAASLVSTGFNVALAAAQPEQHPGGEVGALTDWLDRTKHPGDSAVVLYGQAAVFQTTRLNPAYPFLWTLPQRVLDPHDTRLVHTLDRSPGPTFVVVRSSLNPWGQDPLGRVRHALDLHYRSVAQVCGDSVYLRRGIMRTRPPTPDCT